RTTALWFLSGNIRIGGVYAPTIPAGWQTLSQALPAYITIAPTSVHYPQSGGGPANIYVSTFKFGTVGSAYPSARVNGVVVTYPWIHIVNHQTWVGSGYTTYTVDPNRTPGTRTGYISIITQDGTGKVFTITQDGPYSPGLVGTWTGTITGNFHGVTYLCNNPGSATLTVVISAETNLSFYYHIYINGIPQIDATCSQIGSYNDDDIDYGGIGNGSELFFQLAGVAFFDGFRSGNTITGTVDGVMATGTFTMTKQ